ncbi:MAG: RNA 2',3'-cyclic phosphodiesterase [Clostridia bacterium]|nr:RNA 2',3'-cyclic phosphodiesterase [Clostridia bacterium]
MMRLFAALEPSDEFRQALDKLQKRLKDAGVGGRYLDLNNLHMTLAFIGAWAEDVTEYLPAVEKPFRIRLSHLGVFPEAAVLWAGTEPCRALDDLAKRVRFSLANAQIPFDRKKFFPHITLIRKPSVPGRVVLSDIPIPPAEMTVRDVCLYRSDRAGDGMAYTLIGRSSEGFSEPSGG